MLSIGRPVQFWTEDRTKVLDRAEKQYSERKDADP